MKKIVETENNILKNRYVMGMAISESSGLIMYAAWDTVFKRNVFVIKVLSIDEFKENMMKVVRYMMVFYQVKGIPTIETCFELNGEYYIVVKCFPGQNLSAESGKYTIQQALYIMSQTVDALTKIHDIGFYCLRVLPSQIYISDNCEVTILPFTSLIANKQAEHNEVIDIIGLFIHMISGKKFETVDEGLDLIPDDLAQIFEDLLLDENVNNVEAFKKEFFDKDEVKEYLM